MSSLLELEKNDKSEQDALEKSRLRIQSMALVHEKLYQKEGLAYIEISEFIKELVSEKIFWDESCETLDFRFEMQKAELNINQAIPFLIIVGELIHNISSHAYLNDSAGRIDIKLKKEEDQFLKFEIKDYGVGLPATVRFEEPSSLGLTMVQTLLMQINGRAEVISDDAIGFGVRIYIPTKSLKGPSKNWKVGI